MCLSKALNPTAEIQPNRLQLDELIITNPPPSVTAATANREHLQPQSNLTEPTVNSSSSNSNNSCRPTLLQAFTAASTAFVVTAAQPATASGLNNPLTQQCRGSQAASPLPELSAKARDFRPGNKGHQLYTSSSPPWLPTFVQARQRPNARQYRTISIAAALDAATGDSSPLPPQYPGAGMQ